MFGKLKAQIEKTKITENLTKMDKAELAKVETDLIFESAISVLEADLIEGGYKLEDGAKHESKDK
jgi:hypothetical protein